VNVTSLPCASKDVRTGSAWDDLAAADDNRTKPRIIRRRMTDRDDDAAVRPSMRRHAIRTMEPLYRVAVAARRFHRYAMAVGPTTPWGVLFGVASVVTPALLGAAAAVTASGAIRVSSRGAVSLSPALPWLTPFALDCALLGLALPAQQAAVYLAVEADDAGEPALRRHFQRRALVALGVTAAAAIAGLPLARAWAPVLATGLVVRALPLLILVALAGTGCAVALARGQVRWGRRLAVIEAAAIVWAWGVAQYPYLIVPDVTVANSAASQTTLIGFIAIAVGGGVLLIPALWLLFVVFKGHNPAQEATSRTDLSRPG